MLLDCRPIAGTSEEREAVREEKDEGPRLHACAHHGANPFPTGTSEEREAVREEKAKDERVEWMRRQAARRMMATGLAVGWAAWLALYWARRNALGRLRMAANRLHR